MGLRLKFKGEPVKKAKKKRRTVKDGHALLEAAEAYDSRHGGEWWSIKEPDQLKGRVVLEGPDGCYLKVTADGDVTIGDNYDENAHVEADHRAIKEALEREEREEEPAAASPENQVPSPHESLMAVPIGDGKFVAFKCWTGCYMTVDGEGRIQFLREAVSQREMWTVTYDEATKCVRIVSPNERHLTFGTNGDIRATEIKAGRYESIKVRTSAARPKKVKTVHAVSKESELRQMEENESKRFQSFRDSKVRVSSEEIAALRRAQRKGNVNTTLLDRRSKVKADRYCK